MSKLGHYLSEVAIFGTKYPQNVHLLYFFHFLLYMHEINKAMQELTGVNYDTSEQNKDMTKAGSR